MYVAVLAFVFLELNPFVALVADRRYFFLVRLLLAGGGDQSLHHPARAQPVHAAAGHRHDYDQRAADNLRSRRAQRAARSFARIHRTRATARRPRQTLRRLVACCASAALFVFFRFTRTGTAIRACADNWLGAKVVGLNVKQLYSIAFGLGSLFGRGRRLS